jgi:hypothetical protein
MMPTSKAQAAHVKELRISDARGQRRRELPRTIQVSLLIGDQKDRIATKYGKSEFNINLKRESEIARFFEHRYGGEDYVLPDDDAGRDDALLMAHHQVKLAHGKRRALNWIAARCPWMQPAEAEQIIARAYAQDWNFTADKLAERLGLTFDLRNALGVTTIGSVDVDKAGRKELRKAKDREYQAAVRAASGATPRTHSIRKLEPWSNRAEPMSVAQWYRLPKSQRDHEVEALRQFRRQQDTEYPSGADETFSGTEGLAQSSRTSREDMARTGAGRGLEAAPGQAAGHDHSTRCDSPPELCDSEARLCDIDEHTSEPDGMNSDLRNRAKRFCDDLPFLTFRDGLPLVQQHTAP